MDPATVPDWVDQERGVEPGKCRSCREEVWWVWSKRGKRSPLNADGTSHFATCPDAARWRK